ncbi:MAG: hypothetical protein KDB61_06835 [Planctomycetes bacterium]|nr:hypothetical protein [Planctomycetota bacterium]
MHFQVFRVGEPRFLPPYPDLVMKTLRFSSLAALLVATGSTAAAQHTFFSTDWISPTVGLPDSGSGTAITHGDLLTPAAGLPALGPLATPTIAVSHGATGLGLFPGCVGVTGGTPCPVEVDALSFGLDQYFTPGLQAAGKLHFSVDFYANGAAGAPLPPNVITEGAALDGGGDVFVNPRVIPAGPLPPGAPFGHRGIFDEDGMASTSGFTYPGLGLLSIFATPAIPDNLDALDTLDASVSAMPSVAYFSMDDQGVDPLTGTFHTATANTHGFAGADVVKTTLGSGVLALYAPGATLGLNLVAGLNPDDLDALILRENGDGIFQPSLQPFDWLTGSTDMLLFSVRRGSAVIGMPDSIFGIPIEEGDILTTPLSTAFGGVSPFPGIFYAAERLGLGTIRSGTAIGSNFGDDLNALDSVLDVINDCDGDGIEDVVAIAQGLVQDTNFNGIPDPCESIPICTPLPNSTSQTTLLTAQFTGSPGTGVHVEITQGPPNQVGILLIGTGLSTTGTLIGSGRLCLDITPGNLFSRYNTFNTPMNSVGIFNNAGVMQNLAGTSTVTTGFDIPWTIPIPIGGTITTGSTWHFQYWHRDVPLTSNFSNAITWTF